MSAKVEPRPEAHEPHPVVTCFVSGEEVPQHKAVRVKLGPGLRVWMRPEYTRDYVRKPPTM